MKNKSNMPEVPLIYSLTDFYKDLDNGKYENFNPVDNLIIWAFALAISILFLIASPIVLILICTNAVIAFILSATFTTLFLSGLLMSISKLQEIHFFVIHKTNK